jgi:Co/Zn/Cd efflux system component
MAGGHAFPEWIDARTDAAAWARYGKARSAMALAGDGPGDAPHNGADVRPLLLVRLVFPGPPVDPRYRRALWIALVLNALMFVVELGASWSSRSVSLLADSIDFFGDAGNYAISLAVLGMAMGVRTRAAVFKAACMGGFGVFVLARAAWSLHAGLPPEAATMGAVGFLALAVNGGVALMLYRFRTGDSNMRSVWICSRNDALGNAAVMLAALGVFGTGAAWPDLLVAAVMGGLALSGSWSVLSQARREITQVGQPG